MNDLFKKKSFLRLLIKGNGPAVYALVNQRSKKVLVVGATDFIVSLARHVSLLSNKAHNNRELQKAAGALRLVFHESFEDPSLCQLKKRALIESYKSLGYAIYNKEKLGAYRVRVGLSPKSGRAMAQVQVMSSGKRVWGVKEFASVEEADEWVGARSVYEIVLMAKERLQ